MNSRKLVTLKLAAGVHACPSTPLVRPAFGPQIASFEASRRIATLPVWVRCVGEDQKGSRARRGVVVGVQWKRAGEGDTAQGGRGRGRRSDEEEGRQRQGRGDEWDADYTERGEANVAATLTGGKDTYRKRRSRCRAPSPSRRTNTPSAGPSSYRRASGPSHSSSRRRPLVVRCFRSWLRNTTTSKDERI